MKRLTIEIHGTGTGNRGAELMAIAIAERMRATFPGVRLVVPPAYGDYLSRSKHQFFTTWDFPGRIRSKLVASAIRCGAPSIRTALGILDPSEVDVVLDASGFAFSDQWGSLPAKALYNKMNRPERQKQRLILLPQALGPFNHTEIADATRKLFGRAEFVCARDDQSFAAAQKLGGARRLLQFPDFTLGVRAILPEGIEIPERLGAVVPNYRMMDMTDKGEHYLIFLRKAVAMLRQYGLRPAFVLHDAEEDRRVIEQVQDQHGLLVLTDPDPRVLKGILGKAHLVIGSRFHALVSALSQGVPCIGAGWSHKYPEVFRDFGAADLLLSDLDDFTRLEALVSSLAAPAIRDMRSAEISSAAEALKLKNLTMWQAVESSLSSLSH
jgi:polysaccharide pyruvyl transferase WcaK-like protein